MFNDLHQRKIQYRTGINKLQGPIMDRMLDRNNIESIKRTMQMHEDIFKHQVRELHRVYNVQKMLMDDLKNKTRQQKFWNPMNEIDISHAHSIEQQHHHTTQSLRENLGSIERIGCYFGDSIKIQKGFDLEKPAIENTFIGSFGIDEGEVGTSSYNAFQSNEEMEVDLTLSIGGSSKVKSSNMEIQLACLDSNSGKSRVGECSDTTTTINSSNTVTFTQGLQLK
ncbi:uncharacterized protein [Cicer arietinum]|uniref:uncharacterized protein isoform X2 n=1 Tax=Cicer arietinum TaxID=3827 RepID=UPI00032A5200